MAQSAANAVMMKLKFPLAVGVPLKMAVTLVPVASTVQLVRLMPVGRPVIMQLAMGPLPLSPEPTSA